MNFHRNDSHNKVADYCKEAGIYFEYTDFWDKDEETFRNAKNITVDVYVTSKCIHLYFLCIVTRCLFREVFVMYLSPIMPQCSYREDL